MLKVDLTYTYRKIYEIEAFQLFRVLNERYVQGEWIPYWNSYLKRKGYLEIKKQPTVFFEK